MSWVELRAAGGVTSPLLVTSQEVSKTGPPGSKKILGSSVKAIEIMIAGDGPLATGYAAFNIFVGELDKVSPPASDITGIAHLVCSGQAVLGAIECSEESFNDGRFADTITFTDEFIKPPWVSADNGGGIQTLSFDIWDNNWLLLEFSALSTVRAAKTWYRIIR